MHVVAEIGGVPITTDDVIRHLTISGQLPGAVAEIVGLAAIAREAIDRKIGVSDEELQDAANKFRESAGLTGAQETNEFFEKRGWRLDDFEAHLERSILRGTIREIIVPVERVQTHFGEQRHEYRVFGVSRISIETAEKAREILLMVSEGEMTFPDAARRYSRDESSAVGGGFVGHLRATQFPPAIRGALHGVKVGDILGPFEIPGGATCLRIEAITEPELTQAVGEEIAESLFAEWLDRKISEMNAHMIQSSQKKAADDR